MRLNASGTWIAERIESSQVTASVSASFRLGKRKRARTPVALRVSLAGYSSSAVLSSRIAFGPTPWSVAR